MKPDINDTAAFRAAFTYLAKLMELVSRDDICDAGLAGDERHLLLKNHPVSDHSVFWLSTIEYIKRHFNCRSIGELTSKIERINGKLEHFLNCGDKP